MLLYSSDAPAGWNALPLEVKQKFYNIAGKGDWDAFEAFDHLVPDTLKDNPNEVLTWMDGSPDLGVVDRDVSRIISGQNGGEYSAKNTIMEDMSVNRARGPENMTDLEYSSTVDQNAVDIDLIENHFESASEVATDAISNSATLGEINVGELLMDGILPILGSLKAGTFIASKCETTRDKLGWGSLAAALGAIVMASPAGPVIATGYTGYKVTELVHNLYTKHAVTN
jgi:hypothetical protein